MNPFTQPYGGYGQTTLASPSSHLCGFLKKPVIFVIGLFSTLSALLALVGEIFITGLFSKLFNSITPYIKSGSEKTAFEFMKNFFSTYIIVVFSISTIMALLGAIPYLIMYFRSKGGKKPTGAVTVLQVVSVINLIGACFLVLFALLYVFIIAGSASMLSSVASSSGLYGSSTASGTAAIIPMIIVVIMMAVLAALNLTYAIGYVRLTFSAKSILKDQSSKLKNAGLIGVFNVISAVFSVISTVMSIIMAISLIVTPSAAFATARYGSTTIDMLPEVIGTLTAAMILFSAGNVFNCVVLISKAVAAFGAKRHMNSFIGMPQAPQSPTSYYNDGYSNYDNNSFNPYQNGYTNTNANPYAGNPFGGNDTNYGNPYTSQNGYNGGQNGGNY